MKMDAHWLSHDGRPVERAVLAGRLVLILAAAWQTPAFAFNHPASRAVMDTWMYRIYFVFHEGGHVVFGLFGDLVTALGGTLMQLLLPLACVLSFARRRHPVGAALSLWWLGGSFATVAPYVADARRLELPLHGGFTGDERPMAHDWYFSLGRLGIRHWDQGLAWTIQVTAVVCLLGGLAWATWVLRQQWIGQSRAQR